MIRAVLLEDVPRITEIYAHHVLHGVASFEEAAPDAGEMARRMDDILQRGLPYLVFTENDHVLGYA